MACVTNHSRKLVFACMICHLERYGLNSLLALLTTFKVMDEEVCHWNQSRILGFNVIINHLKSNG